MIDTHFGLLVSHGFFSRHDVVVSLLLYTKSVGGLALWLTAVMFVSFFEGHNSFEL